MSEETMNILIENLSLKDYTKVTKDISKLEQENKILRENAEHNDKVVDKVNWENQQLQKQKDDVVKAIKGILEINNNYSVEKLAPFYSRKWLEDTHTDLLRMLGEIE